MTIDPRFKELESKGFKKVKVENFEYYIYKFKGFSLITSSTDEEFKVFLEKNSDAYWTDVDDIKTMISFLHNTEID